MSAAACSRGPASGAVAAALQFFAASQCLLHQPWPEQAHLVNGTCLDFIVVGGGTAGALLAARLAASRGHTVLLIEAGGDPPQESIIPGFRHSLKGSRYDWNFTTVNDSSSSQALSSGYQRQPRGRMLGGTGSLNDMVYARGFPADYDDWAKLLDDPAWTWDSVLDYFKRTEHMTDENIVSDPELMKYHGRGGEIEVSGHKESTYDTDKFLDAFVELGFKRVRDMTQPAFFGAGRFSHTIRGGVRESTATALLAPAADRDNLFVLKDAFVIKILIANATAYGVEVQLENASTVLQFYASKEVVVTAGTFNTPKLLMMSGIGPKEHLKEMGIEVVADLPVGSNLHDHVMVMSYVAARNGTCYTNEATTHMDIIKYLYDQTGTLSINNGMGAYYALNGTDNPIVPDFAYYPVCVPINSGFYDGCIDVLGFNPSLCETVDKINKDHELLSIAVVLLKPSSRGRVRLSSRDPQDPPLIYSGTFSDTNDLEGFPEALEVVRRLAETSYFKSVGAKVVDLEIEGCDNMEGVERDKCKSRAMAMSAWHAGGTCALGSAVDTRGRVRGVQSLRVADASVMPRPVRGNTNAPVVMIAEKVADFIKEEYGL